MTPDDWPESAHRGSSPPPEAGAAATDPDELPLRAVIRRLLTPARAGLFLGRDDLARLGTSLGFPLPALDRRIMLEHLFHAAAPAGLLPRLLELLAAEADDWIATYAGWERDYPHTATIWAEWRGRAMALRTDLEEMRALAESSS
jgi:hypothetical protein